MNTLLSRIPVRIALAVGVAAAAFLIVRGTFREPQQLCMRSTPGTIVTVRGVTMTATHVPLAFSVAMGRSPITIEATGGERAEGTLTVYDAHSPSLSLTEGSVGETKIDFCNFLSEWDTYTTEKDGVITAYRVGATNVQPTGFSLTRVERDGVLAPAKAIASPSGTYVAYITWDPTLGATILGVAEATGKNPVVLASLTPEQGEMAINELSWSGSKAVAYAEIRPLADGPDENGNAREKTLYRINVTTHAREGVHIDLVP